MKKLKILHFSDHDVTGGSSYYAYRMNKFMNLQKNIDSKMFVLYKNSEDKKVLKFQFKENFKFWRKFYFAFLKEKNKYSFYNYGKYVVNKKSQILNILKEKPNIIIIYNNSNFINPNIINVLSKENISIIFYLTDMEMITGGCHYNFECKNFQSDCEKCPALSFFFKEMAKKNLREKKLSYYDLDLKFLTPNKTVKENLIKSSIFNKFKHKIVDHYLSLDIEKYSPRDVKKNNKKVFSLRSSLNPRKGQKYFIESLEYLKKIEPDFMNKLQINVIGDSSIVDYFKKKKISFNFLSNINTEEKLINFYQESDFFINQSIQDNGPTMVSESLCCGTPVISFDNGAAKDLIINNLNGYLVKTKSSVHLAETIKHCLTLNLDKMKVLKKNSRNTGIQHLNLKKNLENIIN